MTLIKVGENYLNLDHMIRTEFAMSSRNERRVTLHFAAPSPASVGAAEWSVEPYRVVYYGGEAASIEAALAELHDAGSEADS